MTGSGLKFGIALVAFVVALKVWVSKRRKQWNLQTWSCGLAEIAQLWIRYGLVILMLLSAVAPIRSYYAEPGPQDWESAVGYLTLKSGAGDIAILPNGYCEMPLRYYIDHAGKIPSFPAIFSGAPEAMQRKSPDSAEHIWMISCTTAGTPGASQAVPGYRVEEIRQFKGIQVVELNDFPAGQLLW
jgi:hypothetical protein